jgi:hypothetical protein
MFGDAIIRDDCGAYVLGLELNAFRTYRFEATSTNDFCYWYDGKLFYCGQNGSSGTEHTSIQMRGHGGDDPDFSDPIINRWDYVRYGRPTTGEAIVSSNPPSGTVIAQAYPNLDRFTVTFDQPNYVYVADITAEILPSQNRDRE